MPATTQDLLKWLRLARESPRGGVRLLLHRARRRSTIGRYLAEHRSPKLHIGCGRNHLPGWLGADITPRDRDTIYLDATEPLPFADGTLRYIFAEHMIEHITLAQGIAFLRECQRCLQPGGRIRLATPDLQRYLRLIDRPGDVEGRFVTWYQAVCLGQVPDARFGPVTVFNSLFYHWGHRHIYDEATLAEALRAAGFADPVRTEPFSSPDPELANLERHHPAAAEMMIFETMVMEARRPALGERPAPPGRPCQGPAPAPPPRS